MCSISAVTINIVRARLSCFLCFFVFFVKGKFICVILAFVSKLKACFNLHTTPNIMFFICDLWRCCLFIYFFLSHCHSVNKSPINLLMLIFIFISFVECVHLWLIYCAEIRFFFNSVPLMTWAGQHIEQCAIRNFETLMMSCVTSQRERFMNALKPYKLLVFYNHVPEKCFFIV